MISFYVFDIPAEIAPVFLCRAVVSFEAAAKFFDDFTDLVFLLMVVVEPALVFLAGMAVFARRRKKG